MSSAKRNLGTTGVGTLHFWHQRLSGLANLFFGMACVVALTFKARGDHAEVLAWFSQPWMVGLMLAFLLSTLWHMRLGLGVVIDDYVPQEGWRLFYQIINIFITLLCALFLILALLQILLGETIGAAGIINPLMENIEPTSPSGETPAAENNTTPRGETPRGETPRGETPRGENNTTPMFDNRNETTTPLPEFFPEGNTP